jgi:hypothetical protein
MTSLGAPSPHAVMPRSFRLRGDLPSRAFAANDLARELEGFQVSAASWWRRKYRHPQMATALNARAIRNQRDGAEL